MLKERILSNGMILFGLVAAAVTTVGCAEDVGTLDRTRTDKIDKEIFDNNDEWWFRQTIIGTDFQSSGGLFEGLASSLKRVRWTITEDTLYAYSTVEPAVGITENTSYNSKGVKDSKDRRLGVVAAFPISGHFDVQRGYNSSTGQVNNVISENTSDRLWFDRRYMRVDWDSNQIDGVGLLSRYLGRISARKRTVPQSDFAKDYNRARVQKDYIDTVTEYYFQPDAYSCYGTFGMEAVSNCEAGPLTVRNSFVKMPKEKVYEPLLYTDTIALKKVEDYDQNGGKKLSVVKTLSGETTDRIPVLCTPEVAQREREVSGEGDDVCEELSFDMHKRYGYFRTENVSYSPDRHSGSEDNRLYFANRWNIWQTAFNKEGKRIPLAERAPKQIVYHLNVGFPEKELELGVMGLEEEWNRVFTETVRQALNIYELSPQSIISWVELYRGVSDRAYARMTEKGKGDEVADVYGEDDAVDVVLQGLAEEYLDANPSKTKAACEDFNRAYKVVLNSLSPQNLGKVVREGFIQAVGEKGCEPGDKPLEKLEEYLKAYRQLQIQAASSQIGKFFLASKDPVLSVLVNLAYDRIQEIGKMEEDERNEKLKEVTGKLKGAYGDSLIRNATMDFQQEISTKSGEEAPLLWEHVYPEFDDEENSLVKQKIEDSNKEIGGDRAIKPDKMFVILPNSCSPGRLMAWHKEHGDVNAEVMNLFSGKTKQSFQDWIDNKEVNKLREFCAQLEWHTQEAENKKDRFSWERVGDLRYSFVNNVTTNAPWLGYGPAAADPVTGQIISANANFAGQVLDLYAQIATDYQLIFDGRYNMDDDILTGDYMRKKIKELNAKVQGDILGFGFGEVSDGVDSSALSLPDRIELATKEGDKAKLRQLREESIKQFKEFEKEFPPTRLKKIQLDVERSMETTNLTMVEQSKKIEEFLNRADVRSARLQDPMFRDSVKMLAVSKFGKREFTEEEFASVYSEAAFPHLAFQRMEAKARSAEMQNIMTIDSIDRAVHSSISYRGSSQYFKNEDPSLIKKWFLNNTFFATQLHELGHTFGLRHNFSGSYDAVNFSQEYWDVRAAYQKGDVKPEELNFMPKERAEQVLGRPLKGSDTCVGEGDKKLCLRMWYSEPEARETTSIMDYTPGFTNGVTGLGKYDQAAISFAYANKVELFGSFSLPARARLFAGIGVVDYKNLPALFADPRDLSDVPAGSYEEYKRGVDRMTRNRYWVDISEAIQQRYEQVKAAKDFVGTGLGLVKGGNFNENYLAPGNNEVPYRFCSDEHAGGRLGCDRHDWGANPSEILEYSIDDFETFKNLRRYLRGRKSESYQNIRSYIGWLARTLNQAQTPFYFYQIYKHLGWDRGNIGVFKSLEDASMRAYNFMVATYAQPETGVVCLYNGQPGLRTRGALAPANIYFPAKYNRNGVAGCNGSDQIYIDKTQGHDYHYAFTDEYDYRMLRTGSFFDKSYALNFFFRIGGTFSDRVAITDDRTTQAYFWTEFNDQAYDFIEGILLNDPSKFAGVVRVKDGKKVYEPPRPLERENYLYGVKHSQEGLPRVYTHTGYNEEFDTLLLSLLSYSTNADSRPDIVQYLRVVVSDPNAVQKDDINKTKGALSEGTTTAIFDDPLTAKRYVALIPPDGRSITAKIVKQLNDLRDVYVIRKKEFDAATKGTNDYRDKKEILDNVIALMEYYKGSLDRIRWIVERAKILQ